MAPKQKRSGIGPGTMIAAAFIGPGTVTTATLAGAGFGYTLLWAVVFSTVITFVLQEMAARLGAVAKLGLGEALRRTLPPGWLRISATSLVLAAILLGNAAYEGGNLRGALFGLEPFRESVSQPGFDGALLALVFVAGLILFVGRLKWIKLGLGVLVAVMGLVFGATAIALQPDWMAVLRGMFVPVLPERAGLLVVGLIGTTVVPYNLFLHAAAVKKQRESADTPASFFRIDTLISVGLGGLITLAILVAAAATFDTLETQPTDLSDFSRQLHPVLGSAAAIALGVGFLAAGLSSAITAPLAAAFATAEMFGWPDRMRDFRFRTVWFAVMVTGALFATLQMSPTHLILLAQVANGLLLPIVAVFLLWITNQKDVMGSHTNSSALNLLAGVGVLICLVLGAKAWGLMG